MGKKKFIDKKKSATFQLLARDSSNPSNDDGPSGDRIFVRVDDSPYPVHGFFDEDVHNVEGTAHPGYSFETDVTNDSNSIFTNAFGDHDGDDKYDRFEIHGNQNQTLLTGAVPLPDHTRREILELGLPDDGYNYLNHLREIKNTGGGSAFYHNSKAKLDQLPLDVKAYDASKVRIPISLANGDANDNSLYTVAAKTVGLRIQKAVDPEVAALLDDGDMSRFGSDVEDLEEDFVVRANPPEEKEDVLDKSMNSVDRSRVTRQEVRKHAICYAEEQGSQLLGCDASRCHEAEQGTVTEQPRVRRLLDEQFDMLTLQEYDTDSDYDNDGSIAAEGESLADKLSHVLKDHVTDELDLVDKYKVPADFLHKSGGSNSRELVDSASDVIRRCVEYAEMYNENEGNEDVMVLEESSGESEVWDCETIVSTYSNLDNHPGTIEAPEYGRKKKLAETVSKAAASDRVISLRGKERLPVEFLPHSRNAVVEKVKKAPSTKPELPKRRPHSQESKEEKKERKAAVKEERREARKAKKELKELYQCEAQRAQRVAAVSGPSSVHVM
ncbi:protein LTV1 homolog isoform X2 [Telopea speciosissima]|uniref:protein LTV1 homolog isoform X1 n=1 Tax=Telopea speciosissima TaxID=54955 RepID=UPI001CC372F9|nr:protein LTV1 homolog isoform X1 [Telopea speciosissima]XP_043709884.1 protein LTV1 homolog isoform X2 [Telopea speciosissima]